ncbi:MAG: hypothetical protein ACYC2G_13260 [Gemmatimonadaceae bacterium]
MPYRHHLSRRTALATAACTVILAACGETTSPRGGTAAREIGVLQLQVSGGPEGSLGASAGDDDGVTSTITWSVTPGSGTLTAPRVIEVADTVEAGRPVAITVHTVLPNGCWSGDGEDVRQTGLVVEITPQDARSDADACAEIFGYAAHHVTATFAERGTATIRVTGRRIRQGDIMSTDTVTAERAVVVR